MLNTVGNNAQLCLTSRLGLNFVGCNVFYILSYSREPIILNCIFQNKSVDMSEFVHDLAMSIFGGPILYSVLIIVVNFLFNFFREKS